MNIPRSILIGVLVLAVAGAAGAAVMRSTHSEVSTTESQTAADASSTSPTPGVLTATTTSSTKPAASGKQSIAQLALRTNAEWKKVLTPAQYSVLREQGTEQPYSSDLLHESRAGTFVTADCGEPVFRSEAKFDSGTGWPSFYQPIKGAVVIKHDTSLGIDREEVETPICHSHLGHLFHDAPQTPTGDRYCINGVALRFVHD